MELNELISKIENANYEYYTLGVSSISDSEYDALKDKLEELDPNNRLLKQVGDSTDTENKVKLPNTMGSLNKWRPSDVEKIKALYSGKTLLRMPKLDGISMQIEYVDGKFSHLWTRGDGFKGQDITARGNYMPFPKELNLLNSGTVYLFGEAVISKENFELVKGTYKHRRNFVGGTLRPSLTNEDFEKTEEDVKFNCSLIDIVLFGAVTNQTFTDFSHTLAFLEKEGFKVADFEEIEANELTEDFMVSEIQKYKVNYPYLTDGIVLRINDNQEFEALGKESNGLNPRGARAIKLDILEQASKVVEIANIEWNISKRGVFVPVANLKEPINFDGADVIRVTAVNAKYVKENHWNEGAKCKMIRSGDVIPRLVATETAGVVEFPKICPYCKTKLEFNGINIFCPNESCKGRNREQIINFFTELKLKDVGPGTIGKLYDMGFDSFEKILSIKYQDLIGLEGFQATKAMKTQKEVNNCLRDIKLEKLMHISQLFQNEKTSLGATRVGWIVDAYGIDSMLDSLNGIKDEEGNLKKLDPAVLVKIEGIGSTYTKMFRDNYIDFKKLYMKLKPYISIKRPILRQGKLKGMIFTFTQFRDANLEQLIIENGGEVKGISKKVKALFAAGDSTKVKTAEKYGVPVIPAAEAESYIRNLLG